MQRKHNCGMCRYFRAGYSMCRRHAPSIQMQTAEGDPSVKITYDGGAVWPIVHNNDWCGDFELDFFRLQNDSIAQNPL